MSKQNLANIYQAKKKYLQLSNSKDQIFNKVFATYKIVSTSLKYDFDVLIEFDESRPGYVKYYG